MKNKIVSIIVIIVILIAIAGIWVFKNNQRKDNTEIANNIENAEQSINSDFKLNITSEFDIEKLKSYNLPIIIDFRADYCMPCREMEPALIQLNSELQGKAIIRVIDVWRYPDLAEGYPVELIPTQIFINNDGTPYRPENPEELGFNFITDDSGNHILTTHIGILTLEQMKEILKEMGLNE